MPLSERIRTALNMSRLYSSNSSSSFSDTDDSTTGSPNIPHAMTGRRTPTSSSTSSTVSMIAMPALRLKKTFSDLRGAKQRRKDERYHEALAQWALADEREWQYPTWGGPAKKSRKFSREQRDSLRNWGWEQNQEGSLFDFRPRQLSMDDKLSPCASRQNSFCCSLSSSLDIALSPSGQNEEAYKYSSRDGKAPTLY